jgi:hypothetical protein
MFTDWHFDRLPDSYTQNPYLTVDLSYSAGMEVTQEEVAVQPTLVIDQCGLDATSSQPIIEEQLESNESTTLTPSPSVSFPQLREKLKMCIDHTYLLDSQNPVAIQFEQVLNNCEAKLRSALSSTDEGLVVDPSHQKTNTLIHQKNIQTRLRFPLKPINKKYINLPSRKKKTGGQKYIGRVGAVADKWRLATFISGVTITS